MAKSPKITSTSYVYDPLLELELLRGIHLAADAVATARQGDGHGYKEGRREGLALGRPFAPVILV